MTLKRAYRALAAMLCLALAGLPCAMGEADDTGALVEVPVLEQVEFELSSGEPAGEDGLMALEAPTAEEGGGEVPAQPDGAEESPADGDQPSAGEQPAAGEQPPIPEDRAFFETAAVSRETWQDVNLVRAPGFGGALARVSGLLTLSNVLIGGVPARQTDLLSAFELAPGGRIALADDAPLSMGLGALSINKGAHVALSLSLNGDPVDPGRAAWTSADPGVAEIDAGGKLTAVGKGVTTVTAAADGMSAACRVVVTRLKSVKSMKLKSSKLTLSLNSSKVLKVKIKPESAAENPLTWTSSRLSVVSVDESGRIDALSVGKAKITVTAPNGKSASCKVTVKEVKPKKLDFEQLYITMNPGDRFATAVKLSPADASDPTVDYASSDEAVATVDGTGAITAVGCGTATITAVARANGRACNTCKVCVIRPDAARMEGLIIGINPGHQRKTVKKKYPLAPGSHERAYGVKTGACGKWTRVNEYETVLQIGLKLADLLAAEGATVVITRTSNDVNLTNIDRAKMLNAAGVDVALQLHCDSGKNRKAEGCRGIYRTTGDWTAENKALAKALTRAISRQTGCKNLGTRVYNGYMSLNWTTTPSVLLELGYLSNKKEDKLLASDDYRRKMAEGILLGLCDYFGR